MGDCSLEFQLSFMSLLGLLNYTWDVLTEYVSV